MVNDDQCLWFSNTGQLNTHMKISRQHVSSTITAEIKYSPKTKGMYEAWVDKVLDFFVNQNLVWEWVSQMNEIAERKGNL